MAPLVKVGHRSGSRRVESVKKQTTNIKGTPPPHHNQHSSYHMPPLPVISTQMRNEKKTYRTKQKRLGLKTLIYFTLHFSKTKLHIIMYFLCLILKNNNSLTLTVKVIVFKQNRITETTTKKSEEKNN